MKPEEILSLYADRWNIEVFFEEVRACMGYETQRGGLTERLVVPLLVSSGFSALSSYLQNDFSPNELPISKPLGIPKSTLHSEMS